jgi:alkanesulfonate monooxygenase SsuD/methylene tetrahydromethanopterin reductase-like flavin-dependent oxidoreductase (luciferase family)
MRVVGSGIGTFAYERPAWFRAAPVTFGVPVFQAMVEARAALRDRIFRETGMRIAVPAGDLPSARASVEHGFIHGSPARVAEAIAEIDELGIGGVIASFRLGPMPHEAAANSLRLFMSQVAPEFRGK